MKKSRLISGLTNYVYDSLSLYFLYIPQSLRVIVVFFHPLNHFLLEMNKAPKCFQSYVYFMCGCVYSYECDANIFVKPDRFHELITLSHTPIFHIYRIFNGNVLTIIFFNKLRVIIQLKSICKFRIMPFVQ